MVKTITIGLLGLGTVGTGVLKSLREQQAILQARTGLCLEIKKIAVRDLSKVRDIEVAPPLLTADPYDIINDPNIQIVVELIGGYEPAKTLILQALQQGKHVVTANKALLATYGREVFDAARRHHADIGFEASVGGGIPIIRALREGFVVNNFSEIYGILNGTTNYILTEMTEKGERFPEVLAHAQQLGLAEPDPAFDVEGLDAVQKIAILTYLAWGTRVTPEHIFAEGIQHIEAKDITFAKELGYRIKLLAIARRIDHSLEVRVHPTMLPRKHLLATVGGSFNAVYVTGDIVGPTMFYGHGAGMLPTASAVIGDIVDIARNVQQGISNKIPLCYFSQDMSFDLQAPDQFFSRYYFRFTVGDHYGALAAIAGILAAYNISIASVIKKEKHLASVPIVMLTYAASEHDMRQALAEIDRLDIVTNKTVVIRVL